MLKYKPGTIFHHHIWRRLRIGDEVIVFIKCRKIVVRAKVLYGDGIDRYRLEVIEKLDWLEEQAKQYA